MYFESHPVLIFPDVLGNAYLANYFINVKKVDELKNALKAYNQAVTLTSNPFNLSGLSRWLQACRSLLQPWHSIFSLKWLKIQVMTYLEDYEEALNSYKKANEIDATVDVKHNVEKIIETVKHIDNAIANKVK